MDNRHVCINPMEDTAEGEAYLLGLFSLFSNKVDGMRFLRLLVEGEEMPRCEVAFCASDQPYTLTRECQQSSIGIRSNPQTLGQLQT